MLYKDGKSLSAKSYKIPSMDLTINLENSIASLAPSDKIYLYITARAGQYQEEAGVEERYTKVR